MTGENPTLVLLCAGMGSRFGGLKQMAGLGPNGEVLLEYSIYDALKAGFGKIVFIIRKDIEEDFNRLVVSKLPKNIPTDFAFQELDKLPEGFSTPAERTKPWGTAHALWCAKDVVKGNFAVLNADDFYGPSGFQKMAAFLKNAKEDQAQGALVGYRLDKTLSESGSVARGICRQSEAGFLTQIEEKSDIQRRDGELICDLDNNPSTLSGTELVSMNLWGFSPLIFKQIDAYFTPWLGLNGKELKSEFLLPSVIGNLLNNSEVTIKVLPSEDEWIGVTYAEDKEPAQMKLAELSKNDLYPKNLWL